MAIKVLSVEVKQIGATKAEDEAARTRLKELCEMVQQATNYVWMEWFAWHHGNGSAALIQEFQRDWIAYRESGGDKPSLDLKPISNELSNKLYHGVTERWPELHTRVVVLMLNRLTSLIGGKKASKGSFSGWHAILLFREAVPSSIRPLPIPFDTPKTAVSNNGNAKLLLPESDDGSHRLVLSLAREAVKGKSVKQSVKFDCMIWDRGRQMVGRRQTLKKIARGEYQMKGSQLCFSRGKVFANITYEIPDESVKAGDCTAILMPGCRHPLLFRVEGSNRNRWICGDGRVVNEVRRQLLSQRLGRQSAYRQCPTSNNRGHGRVRGIEKVTKLSRRWRDFVTTYSRNLAAAVVSECQRNGVGTLVFRMPEPDSSKRSSRFLSGAGVDIRRDSTSWDWYGLEKRISDKCTEAGIRIVKGVAPKGAAAKLKATKPKKPAHRKVLAK